MLNKLLLNTIGLNRIGLNRIGKPSRGSSIRPYIDPEVLASLKAVCICYGKSNDDPDRAIVKNLVDPDNPFIISNAAYKLNSGFGLYAADFTTWTKVEGVETTSHGFRMVGEVPSAYWILFLYNTIVPSCKIRVSGIPEGGNLKYANSVILKNGINEIPEMVVGAGANGFTRNLGTTQVSDWIGLSVEQIPSYQGAFVTDGVGDLITSTKTVQEMGITDEITVVSMIGQLSTPNVNNYTNTIRNQIGTTGSYNKVGVSAIDKTGIYGYSFDSSLKCSIINDILGDKQDYSVSSATQVENIGAKYLVQGWIDINGLARELSSVAWYWTIIANKVLTTDQINQVIAYYNLDRCVEPTVLYDVKRQGLSNDTPDSDWYLKDFSKNGFDMSLFNFAKKGNSGIGKYEADFTSWKKAHFTDEVNTSSSKIEITGTLTTTSILINTSSTPMYNVKIHTPNKSIVVYFQYNDGTGIKRISLVEGINELPSANESIFVTSDRLNSKGITITQIPSHASALCFDGVEDYGKVTGLPIYKDYTFIIDYERISYTSEGWGGAIVSKSPNANNGAFISMMANSARLNKQLFSFGGVTAFIKDDLSRILFWQTKYKSENTELTVGEGVDGDTLWLGTLRDNDLRFFNGAIYSLMSFPYSLSEFLIERQLKKHKLGTLYPDMVEFRPIVNSNVKYQDIIFRNTSTGEDLVAGQYYDLGTISIFIKPLGCDEATAVKVNNVNAEFNSYDESFGYYRFDSVVTKSPQKIDITIDEYIRYEDIVQPYPSLFTLIDYDTEEVYSWGSKLKVGTKFTGEVINLLPDMYQWDGDVLYNGEILNWGINPGIVAKEMTFSWSKSFKYLFDNNEPKCILSPSRLRIPNSSYKILGYIPDISGHGNHGKINNSAYTEGSGVNADGSYQLDSVDDFITIPTTVGGKQVLMKVNWQSSIGQGMLYDQRGTAFAIWNSDKYNDDETDTIPAYSARNGGNTYIDGILNKNILASQLRNITHNIVATNTRLNGSSVSPTIGCRTEHDAYFTNMSLYDFMLFDEIDSDEEILTLNEYVGIEGNTDDLFTENN